MTPDACKPMKRLALSSAIQCESVGTQGGVREVSSLEKNPSQPDDHSAHGSLRVPHVYIEERMLPAHRVSSRLQTLGTPWTCGYVAITGAMIRGPYERDEDLRDSLLSGFRPQEVRLFGSKWAEFGSMPVLGIDPIPKP